MIVQRKSETLPEVQATVIKCQDQVGHALQDAIEGKRVEGKFYSIQAVEQSSFKSQGWLVLAPTESSMDKRMRSLPALEEFLELRQGVVTGADSIFIVDNKAVPSDEQSLFVPLLRDREMEAYTVPRRTSQSVFFPYFQGSKVNEKELRRNFPKTWAYLTAHREALAKRDVLGPIPQGMVGADVAARAEHSPPTEDSSSASGNYAAICSRCTRPLRCFPARHF